MIKKLFLMVTLSLAIIAGLAGPAVAAQPPEMVDVLIGFDRQPGPGEQAIVHRSGGSIKYTYHLVPAIAASIPEAAIQGLLRNPRVTSIELDITVHAIDAELDNAWGVQRIGAGLVHDGGNKGTGVKIAIIDSGIDYTHPDLDANYAGGKDFVNGDDDPMDDNGHGTHVAGTVAAEDDGIGVVGVAPGASVYALKVLSASGSGSYSDVIAALQWAVDNGIQVTNNSYGSSGDPGTTVKAAFDNSYAAGVLHVAAAGNSGNRRGKGDNVIYPAKWDSVIAVAATDQDDDRARWSSTGNDLELSAPGVAINSTLISGGYGTKSGTSMAAPHVAGVAALVIASGITDTNKNGQINDEVRLRLQETADDLGKDSHYGYGLVDADEAAPPQVGNQAPVADAGPDQSVNTGATVQLDGNGSSDPNGDIITYSWALTTPDGSSATLSAAETASPTFTADKDGDYTVTLTVGDSEFSDTDTVVVTAAANQAPVADAGPDQSVNTGATVQLDGTGSSDNHGDPLTYNWTLSSPENSAASLADTDTATPTFVADRDGDYTLVLTVSDGALSDTDTVVISAATVTEATTVSVTSIDYATEGGKNGDKHLLITVTLNDDWGNAVSGASVSIDLLLDKSLNARGIGTTGTDGTVTFSRKNAPSGTYTTVVTDVTASGLTWDGDTPPNGTTK